MMFRGTVKNGVVVLNGHAELPEGTSVRVVPAIARKKKSSKRAPAKSKPLENLPGFGMWKGRWPGKSSVEVAKQLRRKAMGERYRA
jgi:hypothetical protein